MAASVQVAGMIRGRLVPFHLHLVPRYEGDGLVPPWSLDQPRAEDARLRAAADKIRSAGEDSGRGELVSPHSGGTL